MPCTGCRTPSADCIVGPGTDPGVATSLRHASPDPGAGRPPSKRSIGYRQPDVTATSGNCKTGLNALINLLICRDECAFDAGPWAEPEHVAAKPGSGSLFGVFVRPDFNPLRIAPTVGGVWSASLPPLPPTAGRAARPWVVVWAVIVVVAVVCVVLVGLAAGIEASIRVDRLVPQVAQSTGATAHEMAIERVADTVIGVAVIATQLVPAVLLSVLLVGVWRGSHVARLGMCIVAVLLASSCSLAIGYFSSGPTTTGTAFQRELTRLADDTQPTWVTAFVVPGEVVTIGGPLLAVVLLLTPAANRFFGDSRYRR
jgi:hypothetical protein